MGSGYPLTHPLLEGAYFFRGGRILEIYELGKEFYKFYKKVFARDNLYPIGYRVGRHPLSHSPHKERACIFDYGLTFYYLERGNRIVFHEDYSINFKREGHFIYGLKCIFTNLRDLVDDYVDDVLFCKVICFERCNDLIWISNDLWVFRDSPEVGEPLWGFHVFPFSIYVCRYFGRRITFFAVFLIPSVLIFPRNRHFLDLKRKVRAFLARLNGEWMAIFLGYRDFSGLGIGVRIDLGWFAGDFSSFGFGGGIYFILWRAIRIDLEFVVGLRFASTVFSVFKRVPFERGLMDFEGAEELSFWVLPFGDLDVSVLSGDLSREIGFSYIWVSPPEIRSCDGYKNHEEVYFPRRVGNSLCGDFYYCGGWFPSVPCKLFVLRMGPRFFPASFKMRVRELKFESWIYSTLRRAYSFVFAEVMFVIMWFSVLKVISFSAAHISWFSYFMVLHPRNTLKMIIGR